MFKCSLAESDGSVILSLSGELTLEAIAELRNVFFERLSRNENVVINLDGIDSVDLAVLQMLCFVSRASTPFGNALPLSCCHAPISRAIVEAGLCRFVCRNDRSTEYLSPELASLQE